MRVLFKNFKFLFFVTALSVATGSLTHIYGQAFVPPTDGWEYTFEGAGAENGVDPFTSLDGTWDHNNGSDAWDGTGIGEGNPGGVSALADGDTSYIRVQDTGDPRDYEFADPGSNRKVYLTHNLIDDLDTDPGNLNSILDDGVTLYFRARVATAATGLIDQVHADGGGGISDWPADGAGYAQHNSGKSMFALKQSDGANIAFGLDYGANVNSDLFSGNGLILPHRLIGDTLAGDGADLGLTDDEADSDPNNFPEDFISNEEGQLVPVEDITQWQDFWITIEAGSLVLDPNFPDEVDGTHAINVYSGNSATPLDPSAFVVTAAKGTDYSSDGDADSYIAIGAGATPRFGAFDVDFLSWTPGVHVPVLGDVTGPVCTPLNGLEGDLDGDSEVGFSDFLILSGNFGKTLPAGQNHYELGDIDCGGDVGFADFLTLSGNFGKTVGGAQSVPEPSGFAILLPACLVLLAQRKRQR